MPIRSSLVRFLPWAALAAATALVVVLADNYRDLRRAYAELRRRTATLSPGDVVPSFRASTLDGVRVTIGASAVPGARQVLLILRTTCPFCRATLPIWQRIADSLRHRAGTPIEVYAISLDSLEPTRAYARESALTYPVVVFPERKLARLYRVAAVPQTLVLNDEGRVLYARTGLLDSAAVLDSVFRAAARGPQVPDSLPLAPAAKGQGG